MATAVGFCSVQHAVSQWAFNAANLAADDAVAGLTHSSIPGANYADIDTVVESIGGSQISIPAKATITGVTVLVKIVSYEAPAVAIPFNIQLRGPAGLIGTAKSDPGCTIKTTVTFGGSTDLWGVSLSRAMVNSAEFGVRASITTGAAPVIGLVYYLVVTVHYTPWESAEAKLNAALLAHGALTALVGTRIYRLRFPPGTSAVPTVFPLVVFQRVFTTKEQAITGIVVSRSVRFQITCYSEKSAGGREATTVAEKVEDALIAEGIGLFADVTLRDEKATWNPVAKLYEHMVECECLDAW